MTSSFSQRLRISRVALRMTQADLAAKIHVTRSAIAQWESKQGTSPSISSHVNLAKALDVSFEWLATGGGARNHQANAPADTAGVAVNMAYFARDALEEQLLIAARLLDTHDRLLLAGFVDLIQVRPRYKKKRAG